MGKGQHDNGKNEKKSAGLYLMKTRLRFVPELPKRALYNYELECQNIKIPHFKETFMRDTRAQFSERNESTIINLDLTKNSDVYWVCVKNGNTVRDFDNFDNLKQPQELMNYFGNSNIKNHLPQ